jgi:peroxiredoxin Q/BCP
VMEKYGAFGEKMLYGKRVMGVIRSTFVIGPTGTIEHAWYGVRTDGHAARVLAALAQ